jgi:hypothetical protein
MTTNRFRTAAWALIGFNILGTILTWVAHLQKPNTGAANAIAAGTKFTGPLLFVALGIIAIALTFSARRWLAGIGISLLGLYGVGFAYGEIYTVFEHNVGISTGRWDVVIIGSVVGAIIGITVAVLAAQTLFRMRRADRPVVTPAN